MLRFREKKKEYLNMSKIVYDKIQKIRDQLYITV